MKEIKKYFSSKGRDSITGAVCHIWVGHLAITSLSIAFVGMLFGIKEILLLMSFTLVILMGYMAWLIFK